MIFQERFDKILHRIIDQTNNNDRYNEDLYLNSLNKDFQWVIRFKKIDDICFVNWKLLTDLSKKDKKLQDSLEPEYEFHFSEKNEFINKFYKEFQYYMGCGICNCNNYKLNGYKHCLTCYLTLEYFKDDCSICYEKFFDHPDHYYKSPCCGHKICKSCSVKIKKKKCVICRI